MQGRVVDIEARSREDRPSGSDVGADPDRDIRHVG